MLVHAVLHSVVGFVSVCDGGVNDRLLASAEVSMEAPCTERARSETSCRTTNPEVKRDYACDHSRLPARRAS
jgi:hypothetical protein